MIITFTKSQYHIDTDIIALRPISPADDSPNFLTSASTMADSEFEVNQFGPFGPFGFGGKKFPLPKKFPILPKKIPVAPKKGFGFGPKLGLGQ